MCGWCMGSPLCAVLCGVQQQVCAEEVQGRFWPRERIAFAGDLIVLRSRGAVPKDRVGRGRVRERQQGEGQGEVRHRASFSLVHGLSPLATTDFVGGNQDLRCIGHNSGTARPIKVRFSITLKARGGLYDGKRAMRAWGLGRA